MRDNGPSYVLADGVVTLQDWGFDAWGGNFGPDIPWQADDAVPPAVAAYLRTPIETYPLIHERGDLEFNGADTLIASWSVLSDRNPGVTPGDITSLFEEAFGVSSVVYIEGFDPLDGTTGHVDGIVRFIPSGEVVVGAIETPQDAPIAAQRFDDVAEQIALQRPDLTILRMAFPPETDYMNWLVGNGYVISGAFDNPAVDDAARAKLEQYFPDRVIYMVPMGPLWENGGGVHCVTNDQPAWSLEG